MHQTLIFEKSAKIVLEFAQQGGQSGDPDEAIYYKWAPAEWSHEAYTAELFDGISEELAGLSDSMSPEQNFEAHCERIFKFA